MVHSISPLKINPSSLFQIRLEQDTLTMRGSPSESVGCVLRGQLVLALNEPIKVREIRMIFRGKSKVNWIDGVGAGQSYHSEERIFYQHEWTFLPAKKNYHILSPKNYCWDFELILPGILPETVEGCENGYVHYKLKAVAERHKFALNLNTQRAVHILRCPLPTSLDCTQSLVIANTWSDKVEYEIVVASRAYTFGEKIPIDITLKPLQKHLAVKKFTCSLKEYTTYHVGQHTKKSNRIIRIGRDDKFPSKGDLWTTTELLQIPTSSPFCQYDTQNEIIRVRHKLKFTIQFINEETKHLSELRASMSIIITPINGDAMFLPAYDEHYLGAEMRDCNSILPPISRDILSSSDNSSTLSGSSGSSTEHKFPEFDDLELMKLPTYRSITALIPAPVYDSLPPTYDACIGTH
ncbi:10506_t:CDS:2 [Ambispora leptoticha]|uniref:10506_t:CDS:1 n=1 Tax=Ambispora leptoticha TaxID=144679 RepID=A0A9N9AIY2_9GLOM|nr:10506_t:CDS:2 [Ambispora leptoticha]